MEERLGDLPVEVAAEIRAAQAARQEVVDTGVDPRAEKDWEVLAARVGTADPSSLTQTESLRTWASTLAATYDARAWRASAPGNTLAAMEQERLEERLRGFTGASPRAEAPAPAPTRRLPAPKTKGPRQGRPNPRRTEPPGQGRRGKRM